jgi:hypothetical protein
MFQWNPQGYFIPCYHLFAMLSLSWISTELVSGFILVTRSVTSNFLSKLWWNKQKNKCLNKHPCRTQVGSLQSTNALQMKLAPKPTLIIVASSKVLIQVEHDDWRFRERTVISPKSITGVSVNQKGKHNWPRYHHPPTHSHAKFFLIWFIAAKMDRHYTNIEIEFWI